MDPTLPEAIPSMASSQEQMPQAPGSQPGSAESAPNVAPEQPREVSPAPSPATQHPLTPAPTAQPIAPLAGATGDGAATAQPTDDSPIIADDVDVIEKEWVDKAKKIVNSTKEDPYSQEKEVSKLQADYLMKRYNKQVKLSE